MRKSQTPTAYIAGAALALLMAGPALGQSFSFSTGAPDGRIGLASRPDSPGKIETEAGDDFILKSSTQLNSATFTGLLTGGVPLSSIVSVDVELYHLFPKDSQPPNGLVPTRVNSPADNQFDDRDSRNHNLTFSVSSLNSSFTAANSILNSIHVIPSQTTGGEGSITGNEVQFTVNFTTPFILPADHYFFVPQVQVKGGEFFWLSAPGPAQFKGDLQAWIRNADLAPNWLRAGTDIVGGAPAPKFNESFSLSGQITPEPSALTLCTGLALPMGMFFWRRRRSR